MWIMRQAGRYLPEYREVRSKVDFRTLCETPELSAKVTLQPLARFDLDAAIVFADIMTPLESMGVSIDFAPGPVIQDPIRDRAAVDQLRIPEKGEIATNTVETVRILSRELESRVPLIGFAGAPLTVAAYLVEGKGSKDFNVFRSFLYRERAAADELLDRLTQVTSRYLQAQIDAGAKAIQLFDSWAGILSARDYESMILPYVQRIFSSLDGCGVPRIYFAQDAAALGTIPARAGADVIGVDWRTDLRDARRLHGDGFAYQGNFDPARLRTNSEVIESEVKRVLESGGGTGHIFNLGHGILPDTPIESVHTLVDAVRRFSSTGEIGS